MHFQKNILLINKQMLQNSGFATSDKFSWRNYNFTLHWDKTFFPFTQTTFVKYFSTQLSLFNVVSTDTKSDCNNTSTMERIFVIKGFQRILI